MFAKKVCARCSEKFEPRNGNQKLCDACRAKAAEKPVKAPTKAEVAARNGRQRETIKRLQEEIGVLKAKILAPQRMLLDENERLKRAIEHQRVLVGEEQRKAAAFGQRRALRRAIEGAILALRTVLEEDNR